MKKKGKFYKSKGQHNDTTTILCTESTMHETRFSGVCVVNGNNSHVGEYSEHWNEHYFCIETILTIQ